VVVVQILLVLSFALFVLSEARLDGTRSNGLCGKRKGPAQAEQEVCTRLHTSTRSLEALKKVKMGDSDVLR
jgi:hypothetical protein